MKGYSQAILAGLLLLTAYSVKAKDITFAALIHIGYLTIRLRTSNGLMMYEKKKAMSEK